MLDMPTGRRTSIFALLLSSEFFYGWSWNSVDVLRPFLKQSLALSLLQAGSLYSAQGAGALCGAVTLGQMANRFGRRGLLSVVIPGYGTMLLLGLAVATYPELLAQRFFLGVLTGASFPVSVGLCVTLFPPRHRGQLAGILKASFSCSIIMLGLSLGLVSIDNWRTLLWIGGLPPLLLALLAWALIPREPKSERAGGRAFPVAELFRPPCRAQTVAPGAMTGLIFFGYQAYDGWLATCLISVRGLTPGVSGHVVAWQFACNLCRGFARGWAGDRFGRRFNALDFVALGFVTLALLFALFLALPAELPLLYGVGFLSGAALCSSVIWGPWFAELYPFHLRSTAASIFNWGRVIRFFAPLLTARVAERYGMGAAMSSGCVSFAAAALLWRLQRETLRRAWSADPASSGIRRD